MAEKRNFTAVDDAIGLTSEQLARGNVTIMNSTLISDSPHGVCMFGITKFCPIAERISQVLLSALEG